MNAILRTVAGALALLCAGVASGTTVALTDIDSGLPSPTGNYRWLNAADQAYASSYRTSYNYTQASVSVAYDSVGTVLAGTLSATNLKPNFAYQLKLVGWSGTASNERIGLDGRWWQEEWSGSAWVNGQNLNNKGTGTSPNPNDLVYLSRRDVTDATSPTGRHYRYSAYLVFDYFVTDDSGKASLSFRADDSYHVLWKTSQASPVAGDGPVKSATFDPSTSNPAYDTNWPAATVGLYGEWERLPAGGVYLANGTYSCGVTLTEESFHSTLQYGGGWAAAMGGQLDFTITRPGDSNGDGKVDGTDLSLWQQHYDPLGLNAGGNSFAFGDWNGDGKVDGADLALWQRNYDPTGQGNWGALETYAGMELSSLQQVPEPATVILMVLSVCGLPALRRRHPA